MWDEFPFNIKCTQKSPKKGLLGLLKGTLIKNKLLEEVWLLDLKLRALLLKLVLKLLRNLKQVKCSIVLQFVVNSQSFNTMYIETHL
jgi:hypothetical protein